VPAGTEVLELGPRADLTRTQAGGRVHAEVDGVSGTFDDCQRLVKEAFVDPGLRSRFELSSANSINLGRLLPQAVYYAASSLQVRAETGAGASYIIPSGNLGNSAACIWAKTVGLPIGRLILAHNANRTVPDYLATGQWQPRPSVASGLRGEEASSHMAGAWTSAG
jgi:threonine synthase